MPSTSPAHRPLTALALGVLLVALPLPATALEDQSGDDVAPVETEATPPGLPGFELVGTAPAAAAQPTELGRRISTLQYHGGRVYYGHGDYADNAGSMTGEGTDVAYYSILGEFGTALENVPTEEISTFRQIGDRLVAPLIDPSAQAGALNSFASGAESWQLNAGGTPSVHLYDVAGDGDALYLATGDADGAGVWRSTDDGATWSRSLHGSDPTNDGYERYYWLGVIGGDVYARMHHGWDHGVVESPVMRHDSRKGWVSVRGGGDFGRWTMHGADVQAYDGTLWTFHYDTLQSFNGKKARTLDPGVGEIAAITPDATGLYVLGSNGVVRIDERGTVRPVIASVPGQLADATAMAVGGGRIWVGTRDSQLWSRSL